MDAISIQFFYESFKQFFLKSEGLSDIREITQFFCNQVIPYLADHPLLIPLRKKWMDRRQELTFDIQIAERDALKEVSTTFRKIERALPSAELDSTVRSMIERINRILAGKERYCSPPLYEVLFDEIDLLLERLLSLGHINLCRRFAEIEIRKVCIPKDPSAADRWGISDSKGNFKRIEGKKLARAQNRKDYRLMSFGPEMIWVDCYKITACKFAPSLKKVSSAHHAASFENMHNPEVIWWYFESALFLWNLPENNFDQPVPRLTTKRACKEHFETMGAIRSWREVVSTKYPNMESPRSNIFTPRLFKEGLRTLHAAIVAYFSSYVPTISPSEDEQIVFKLVFESTGHSKLKSHHLWLLLKVGDTEPTPYYLKRFNDGSPYFDSVCDLLRRHSNGGKIQIELKDNSDSIAKWIDRFGLGKVKKIFFEKPQGNKVFFKGKEVRSSKKVIPNFHVLLKELQIHHQKAKAPVFSGLQNI